MGTQPLFREMSRRGNRLEEGPWYQPLRRVAFAFYRKLSRACPVPMVASAQAQPQLDPSYDGPLKEWAPPHHTLSSISEALTVGTKSARALLASPSSSDPSPSYHRLGLWGHCKQRTREVMVWG
jgi:hypothetical protein